jgi:hypothetical protein
LVEIETPIVACQSKIFVVYRGVVPRIGAPDVIPDDIVFKRTFNTKSGQSGKLGPSAITQPMFASYCTGLVRAALCEALSRLPPDAIS